MVGSAHGQLTFKRSHRLARGKAFESLGTQTRRMVSAADSRGPGREQGSGEPVDEAGSRGRRSSGPKAPTRPWSIAAPERGAADETARASGAGSRGSRLSGRSVDVRESGYSDPKRVRGQLPPGSRESFSQSLEAEPAEATAPGESEGRGGHRALERTEMAFPQKREKRALKEGRTIVFADQSGFYLLPMVVRTYAPVGKTPILKENLTR